MAEHDTTAHPTKIVLSADRYRSDELVRSTVRGVTSGATGSVAALLITGTVGAGKTTIAEGGRRPVGGPWRPHAVVDLDQLRLSWPTPAGDPFNHAMEVCNLAAVAANYFAAGATRLILAGVIERRSDLADYQEAVGCAVVVVRLLAHLSLLSDRLRERHSRDPDGLAWHLARAPELTAILDRARVADAEVETSGRPIGDIAADVLAAGGW